VSNGYVDAFIHDLSVLNNNSEIIFKYPAIIVSVSQISEIIFILCIPILLKRFSLKTIIIFGFSAWILKFLALYLAASSSIFVLLLISSVCYGIAFDLFIIPGSLFLEENVEKERRGSVQGVFVMMVNGFGSLFGSFFSGFLIEAYFTKANNDKYWTSIWLFFAVLMFVIIIFYLFLQFFKTKQKHL
jgi:NHS family xanthosine MFS transporter